MPTVTMRFRCRAKPALSSYTVMTAFLKAVILAFFLCTGTQVLCQDAYKLLPSSAIRISGTSTVSNWVVSSAHVSGMMMFDSRPGATTASRGTIKEARASVEVESIKSEKGETMDNKMYNALKKDANPLITFTLSDPLVLQAVPGKLAVKGVVNLAGVTRTIIFDLNVTHADNTFHFQGTKSLKMSDFEIEPPTAMFGQIVAGDEIAVEFDLRFGK